MKVKGLGRKAAPLRVLNYAVNGLGLGHLTRLIAINRQVRRLSSVLSEPAEITFLTSSEADSLAFAHNFAAFKIPAKGIVPACGLDPARYRKVGKQWVWNAINLISPDILIVDTFPAGSFHELYDVLDFGQKNVFIYRAVREGAARQPDFQSALRGYHLILKPQEQGENDSPVPESMTDKVATVGEILIRSASEILSREEARETLGIALDVPAVYISTGGGGDTAAQAIFADLVAAAKQMPQVRFVVGAGPLYRGREFAAPNITWSYRHTMMEYFRAFDAAITAGGFNSVGELMHCGIPCAFLPQPRSHDDQEKRVARCVAAGAGILLPSLAAEDVVFAVTQLLGTEFNLKASEAAKAFLPINHALAAAEMVLSLVYPAEVVEQAALLCDPAWLNEAQKAGHSEANCLAVLRVLWQKQEGIVDTDAAEALMAATLHGLTVSKEQQIAPGKLIAALKKAPNSVTPDVIMQAALTTLSEPPNDEMNEETTHHEI